MWKLFEELKENHATFEFEHGHGLGVVAFNKIPSALKQMFAANKAASDEWRQTFSTLGNSVTQKWQANQEKLQAQQDRTQLQEQIAILIQNNEKAQKINDDGDADGIVENKQQHA